MTDTDIAALVEANEAKDKYIKQLELQIERMKARAKKAEAYIAENADGLWMKRQVGYAMRAEKAEAEIERLREELERIVRWSEAYPLDVFPEPDFKKARELLKAGGMTIDAISTSNMRHVVEGVGRIARDALSASN